MSGHTNTANWMHSSFRSFGSHIELIARPLSSVTTDAELTALVQSEFAACEGALSRFSPDSELVRLNLSLVQRKTVSIRLWEAIALAVDAYRDTEGVFDPRVSVLHDLGYQGAAFDVAAGAHGLSRKECAKMWPEDRSVLLYTPIDLGNIGKSYALERAALLLDHCAGDYLLSAGGELVYAGTGPGDTPWRIGVESRNGATPVTASLQVTGRGAVCTAAADRRRWQDSDRQQGRNRIDPAAMGAGGCGLASVTVLADRSTKAEVLSKLYVLRGLRGRVEAGIKVWAVTEDGDVIEESGESNVVVWSDVSPDLDMTALDQAKWQQTPIGDAQTAGD